MLTHQLCIVTAAKRTIEPKPDKAQSSSEQLQSKNSVQRKQAEVRQEILQNITKSVLCAGLSHLSILWDRKRLKNSDGETYEAELILVSGAPDY